MLIGVFSQYLFGIAIFVTSVFLVMLVLVQRGRGGGLVGALGGPGGQSALGTKAGDVFTRITIVVAAIWIFLCARGSPRAQSERFQPAEPGWTKWPMSAPDRSKRPGYDRYEPRDDHSARRSSRERPTGRLPARARQPAAPRFQPILPLRLRRAHFRPLLRRQLPHRSSPRRPRLPPLQPPTRLRKTA